MTKVAPRIRQRKGVVGVVVKKRNISLDLKIP